MARPDECIPAVTLYAEKEEVQTAFQKVTKVWICHTCRQEFSLLESMGALNCYQHPGYVQEDGRWSCCGKRQIPARWSQNWDIQRMYDSGKGMPYKPITARKGCQPCDHNISDMPYTHKDAKAIQDLSALLPFMNKEFPFHLRKGFDNGVLRRCARRKIVVPPNAAKVVYMDNKGEKQEFIPAPDTTIPEGIEISASDANGVPIGIWR